jgi:hypothetical protein
MIVALSELGLSHFRELFYDKSSAHSIEDKQAVELTKRYRCTVQPTGIAALNILYTIKPKLPYTINVPVMANMP